jgi:hypothetical protein
LLFFFGFVKSVAEFGLPWLHRSLVFTSYYSSHTSEKAIMTTYDNPRCGKRLVWTLFVFIFVHILIYVDMRSQFM